MWEPFSGISLTSANIANATGVAIGSMLFLRWLNYFGLSGSVVPAYTQWTKTRGCFWRRLRDPGWSLPG